MDKYFVGEQNGGKADEELTDEGKDRAHAGDQGVTCRVGPDGLEGILGGRTETLACEHNLDIGVLVEELDKSFEASH